MEMADYAIKNFIISRTLFLHNSLLIFTLYSLLLTPNSSLLTHTLASQKGATHFTCHQPLVTSHYSKAFLLSTHLVTKYMNNIAAKKKNKTYLGNLKAPYAKLNKTTFTPIPYNTVF